MAGSPEEYQVFKVPPSLLPSQAAHDFSQVNRIGGTPVPAHPPGSELGHRQVDREAALVRAHLWELFAAMLIN